MTILALLALNAADPAWRIGVAALVLLAAAMVYLVIRWFFSGPRSAEPWGEEVDKELDSDEAVPLCHRCLVPHSPAADFCPNCGATVGQYTNWLPYPYIFSLGDTLRLGTAGQFHRTFVTEFGFLLLALAEYSVFAPLYWIRFFLPRSSRPPPSLPAPG